MLSTKKNIFLWVLYDFANSIITISFLFYFSQWIVVDSGRPDWWFNAALIASSLLFVITAPFVSMYVDRTGRKIMGLRWTTLVAFVLYFATACITLFASDQVVLAVILYTIALYSYLMCFLFYTPMMNDISTEENRSHVSGLGQGGNYLGQVAGLLITLPFATGVIHLFGAEGRAQALLPSVILFGLLALPMLIKYREDPQSRPHENEGQGKPLSMNLRQTLRLIFSTHNLFFMLVGYFFFSDALLTFSNNFPIYLEKVHGVNDSMKAYLSLGILFLSGIGAMVFGKIADKKGKRETLIGLLLGWCVLFPALAFAPTFGVVIAVCLIAGFLFGPVWGVSRSMVAEYAPREIEASSFSFYIIAERFATFIGPIIWSVVLSQTVGSGVMSYSYGVLSMGVLMVIGLLFVRKIS